MEEYMRTVKDLKFTNRSEMRGLGKVYSGKDDIYIKIRVELFGMYGNSQAWHIRLCPWGQCQLGIIPLYAESLQI